MLPEKLPRNKALVELEPRPGGATDLAGDAGAPLALRRCGCTMLANAVTSRTPSNAAYQMNVLNGDAGRLARSCTRRERGRLYRRCRRSLHRGSQCGGQRGGQHRPQRWLLLDMRSIGLFHHSCVPRRTVTTQRRKTMHTVPCDPPLGVRTRGRVLSGGAPVRDDSVRRQHRRERGEGGVHASQLRAAPRAAGLQRRRHGASAHRPPDVARLHPTLICPAPRAVCTPAKTHALKFSPTARFSPRHFSAEVCSSFHG